MHICILYTQTFLDNDNILCCKRSRAFIDNRAVSFAAHNFVCLLCTFHSVRADHDKRARITPFTPRHDGKKKRVSISYATYDGACSREDGGKNARTNRDRRGHGPFTSYIILRVRP